MVLDHLLKPQPALFSSTQNSWRKRGPNTLRKHQGKGMAGIPAQTPHPPAVPVLAELSSFLTVFGLDVRLGESVLLASSFELKVSLRWGCCQISRMIGLSHNSSPFSEARSHNVSCEGLGRTKPQELTYISSTVAWRLLWYPGAWALNKGSTSLCVSKFFLWAWGQ